MPRSLPAALLVTAALLLPATPALAERVVDTGNRWLKVNVGQRCAEDPAYAQITKSRALQNNYFVNDLVFDGENCVQPAACDTWACPRQGVPEEWNAFKTKTRTTKRRSEAESLLAQADLAGFLAREQAYQALPAGTATLLRQGRPVASGALETVMASVRSGDRIELGKGRFDGTALAKAPDGLVLVGQGPETVLMELKWLPARSHWLQDMTLVRPKFQSGWRFKLADRPNILVRITFNLQHQYGSAVEEANLENTVTILGSFGRVPPSGVHLLPSLAFGTHMSTSNEYGDLYDHYAIAGTLPDGPLRQWLQASIPATEPKKMEKALKEPVWKYLPAPDAAVQAAIAAWKPQGTLPARTTLAVSAVQSWLAPAGAGADSDPVVAAVSADLAAQRPLSALLRATRTKSADFAVADRLVTLGTQARSAIADAWGCHIGLDANAARRGPQNDTLKWENVPYGETLYRQGVLGPERRYLALVPVAALADIPQDRAVARCTFVTTLDLDAWQYEKVAGNARIDKTEWYLTEQGRAKQRAAFNAALSGLDQAFNAAASSIENTWRNFDAYRTRIQTTQTGDQYLLSYQGDRNAGNRVGFPELERLRQQTRGLVGPGAPGDYYRVTNYVVDAHNRFRHRIEYRLAGALDQNPLWAPPPRVLDQTWDGAPCQDFFVDDGNEVRTAGSTCMLNSGYKVTTQLGNDLNSALAVFVNGQVIPRIDATIAAGRKSPTPAAQAEAALLNVMMGRAATPTDTAALKSVFGADITPDNVRKTLQAVSARP